RAAPGMAPVASVMMPVPPMSVPAGMRPRRRGMPVDDRRPVMVVVMVVRPEGAEAETDHRSEDIGLIVARRVVTADAILPAAVQIARAHPAAIARPADVAPAARATEN